MEWLVLAAVATTVVAMSFASVRAKRRFSGTMTGSLGVVDEIFQPTAHNAQLVQVAEQEVPAPAPLPGDPAVNRVAP